MLHDIFTVMVKLELGTCFYSPVMFSMDHDNWVISMFYLIVRLVFCFELQLKWCMSSNWHWEPNSIDRNLTPGYDSYELSALPLSYPTLLGLNLTHYAVPKSWSWIILYDQNRLQETDLIYIFAYDCRYSYWMRSGRDNYYSNYCCDSLQI